MTAATAAEAAPNTATQVPVNLALLERLRGADIAASAGGMADEWSKSGVAFAASAPRMEQQFARAVRELADCIKPMVDRPAILQEGGIYLGCWLESTGTINAELLSRFLPSVSRDTYAAFADNQRDDGLIPYKLTANGPAFSQIQLVTPLARCVWNDYLLNGHDRTYLLKMYNAMSRYDEWLATWRNTRRTGGVEAFCCYDTGHDLSSRFWHMPDSPALNDGRACDAGNPFLPLVAPDLTANVACQRMYLGRIAEELGGSGETWRRRAEQSVKALFDVCFDATDGLFYDQDRHGRHLRVQSDVLLRVLACEVGDDAFFERALGRYLLSTRKFFARYPFTSVAMDDPRFDPNHQHNSWNGPSNFLSLIRAPHAFEAHGRHVELSWAMQPILAAQFRAERFAQCVSPYTGEAGFTESYSPSILCLLDFIERLAGILPRPDGTLWFTGLVPAQLEHRDEAHETAYARTVDGRRFELVNSRETTTAFRNGELLFQAPHGVRIVTDRAGSVVSLIGMSARTIAGNLFTPRGTLAFRAAPNEQLDLSGGEFSSARNPGLVLPTT
jgi:hypothetical protein